MRWWLIKNNNKSWFCFWFFGWAILSCDLVYYDFCWCTHVPSLHVNRCIATIWWSVVAFDLIITIDYIFILDWPDQTKQQDNTIHHKLTWPVTKKIAQIKWYDYLYSLLGRLLLLKENYGAVWCALLWSGLVYTTIHLSSLHAGQWDKSSHKHTQAEMPLS